MLVSISTRAIGMESAATPHKSELRKTPLNALHRRLGAKMVNFGGWDMPVEYPSSGGLIAEHKAVRAGVGVFDVSHMGDIRMRSGLKNILIARTGYTGEDGFEIYVPSAVATSERVWNQVMEAGREFGIVPCGLGCRNTLRLESKMALYGHEISDKLNVWETGLDRY